ncbi:Bifunctional IPC transferase and DIPP synthase [bacterium HR37]|nr:Bifunctional IPC transferase and DIPP synthase [bacterium HR37]
MKAVILAAGRGKRLYPYTKYIPKCLLDIGGETILEHQLNNLRDCGINEVVIVVGFGFEKVEHFLRNYDNLGISIKTLYNPFYQTTNSLISLWIARSEMNDDIVVINGDDIFEIEVLEQAISVKDAKICLPIKRKPSYEEEDMKVVIRGDKIVEIGKTLNAPPSAESVGIRVFKDTGVELIRRALEEETRTAGAEKKWYVSAIQRLIKNGYKIKYLDIKDLFWMDVDYPSDLFKARLNSSKLVRKAYEERMLQVVETGQ